MKIKFLVFFAIALFVSSCKTNQHENDALNSFLKVNYNFKYKIYNRAKASFPTDRNYPSVFSELDELDSDYKKLITKIDIAIANPKVDINPIIHDYDKFSRKMDNYIRNKKKYLKPLSNLQKQSKNVSTEYFLNTIKNSLVIKMPYLFEYQINVHRELPSSRIRSNIKKINKDKIKLTLSNKIVQSSEYPYKVIINNFRLNGKNKKANYTNERSYVFADLILDSLANGNYELDGVLRFYERNGEYDLPFSESFIVE